MATLPTVPGARTYPGWMETGGGGQADWQAASLPVSYTFQDAGWLLALKLPRLTIGSRDSQGGTWAVTSIEGLYGAAVTYETGARAWTDGAWVSRGFHRGKHVSVGVRIKVPQNLDAGAIPSRLNVLKRALPWREPVRVLFKDWDHVYSADAMIEDEVTVTRAGRWHVEITIPFFLPDPVLLAADWATGEAAWVTRTLTASRTPSGFTLPLQLPHVIDAPTDGETRAIFDITGAAPARALLRIEGAIDQATIIDDAGWVTHIRGRVDAGQTLIVDPHTRQVSLDGASRRAWLTGWPVLEPGRHAVTWTSEGASESTRLHIEYVETTI